MMKSYFSLLFLVSLGALPLRAQVTPAESDANQQAARVEPLATPVPSTQIDVQFVGATSLPETELREAAAEILSAIESQGLTAPRADDTAFYIEVFYRRRGFTYSVVNWEIANSGRTLVLTVDEGPLTNLDGTTFAGNNHYADSLLNDYLIGTTRERFSRLENTLPYVEQDIDTGLGRLENFYRSEGFLDAEILPWPVEYSADLSTAKLGVTINEGLQYWLGAVEIIGATPEQETILREKLIEARKSPYTELILEKLQSDLEFGLKSKGYFNAKLGVAPVRFDTVRGMVDAQMQVAAGEKFTFDGVTSKGTERLRPGFVEKRLGHLSGKQYDPAALDEVYREMVATGLFSEFRVQETPIEGNQIRLDAVVQESPAKEFGFYGGFATYDGGFIGTSYQDRNFLGFGRPIQTSLEMSQRGFSGGIEYTNPWFLQRGTELRLALTSRTTDNDGYSLLDLALRADLTRKFTKEFRISLFVLVKTSEATAEEIDPLLLGPLTYQTLSFGLSQTLDYRNNPLAPGRGWVFDSALAATQFSSGGSGLRTSLRLSYYLPLGSWLLAVGARSSAFIGGGDLTEVPIDERYFNGGSSTVRSFGERELGPLFEDEFPLGGLSRTILNAELVFPVISDLKGAFFLDAGNLLPTDEFFSTQDFRYGVGVGIRYNLPVGPLRLDYGFNPSAQPGEKAGAFHFSFGFAF